MTELTKNSRFQMMSAMDCPDKGRKMGNWYTATPPICDCNAGISPADCPGAPDGLHFTADGYRILGKRYGKKMLSLKDHPILKEE